MAIENTNNTDFTNYASCSNVNGLPCIQNTAGGAGTVCFWAYFNGTNASSFSNLWMFSDSIGGSISLRIDATNSILQYGNNTVTLVNIKTGMTTGNWFFCALTWAATAMVGYHIPSVGGTVTSASATSGGTWVTSPSTSKFKMFDSNAGGDFFKGYIAHFKCWHRTLSQAELVLESAFRYPVRSEGLCCWYPMDETNLATALTDYGRGGLNLTHNQNGSGTLVFNAAAPSGLLPRYVPLTTVVTNS